VATPPSPTSPPSPRGLAGRLLGNRYRLNRPIASGGMAQVWEATDQVLTRRVAVKILHQHLALDESFVRRFRAEAIAAARLAHPSIVSVYDTLTDDGLEAIVMELVVGTTMRADLDQHGPLRLDAVLAIGTQVADALGAAHASGLVHRDVKPANILLSADGRVLVADFGIAKAAEAADHTSDGSMVGTAKYLAPEQVEGSAIDGRADLYSLGIVLYEALTGQAPFIADTDVSTALARLHRDAVAPRRIRPDIPPAVEAVVVRAMARRPADRFPTTAAMRSALLAAGADPARAPAVAVAAAAADTGERRAVRPATPPPPPMSTRVVAHPVPVPVHPQPARVELRGAATGRQRARRWPVLLGILLVGAIVAGGLVALRGSGGSNGRAVTGTTATAFDPGGKDGENDAQAGLAVDGDTATAWETEGGYGNPDLAAGKGGVGLVVSLPSPTSVRRLDLSSPDDGWAASVYAIKGPLPTDLAGWGKPVAKQDEGTAGTTRIDAPVDDAEAVLVWLTKLPARRQMAIGEVSVRAR